MGKASGEISGQAHQFQQPGSFLGSVQPMLFPPFLDGEALSNDISDPKAGIGGGSVVLKSVEEP